MPPDDIILTTEEYIIAAYPAWQKIETRITPDIFFKKNSYPIDINRKVEKLLWKKKYMLINENFDSSPTKEAYEASFKHKLKEYIKKIEDEEIDRDRTKFEQNIYGVANIGSTVTGQQIIQSSDLKNSSPTNASKIIAKKKLITIQSIIYKSIIFLAAIATIYLALKGLHIL